MIQVLTAKLYNSEAALEAKLIDANCPIELLEEKSIDLAKKGLPFQLGLDNFNPEAYKTFKMEL